MAAATTALTMSDPSIPPEATGALLGGTAVSTVYLGWRAVAELLRLRADRAKSFAERDTAELLGEKAMAEARAAGVLELAKIMGEQRLELNDQRARIQTLTEDLEEERSRGAIFRSAVTKFIAIVSSVLHELPTQARVKIQAGLIELQQTDGWE